MFSPQSRLRHAVADTFAMVVYCSVVNMLIEIFLSGMSFEQSLYSRLVAIPVNILIAWYTACTVICSCARRVKPRRQDGQKSGGCAGLCHLPVAGVCDYSADGWRGLAPDYGCSKFEHRGINADGRCLWLLS